MDYLLNSEGVRAYRICEHLIIAPIRLYCLPLLLVLNLPIYELLRAVDAPRTDGDDFVLDVSDVASG